MVDHPFKWVHIYQGKVDSSIMARIVFFVVAFVFFTWPSDYLSTTFWHSQRPNITLVNEVAFADRACRKRYLVKIKLSFLFKLRSSCTFKYR